MALKDRRGQTQKVLENLNFYANSSLIWLIIGMFYFKLGNKVLQVCGGWGGVSFYIRVYYYTLQYSTKT